VLAVAFPDGFPVSDGHVLVVPLRHVERLEELSADEWARLFALVQHVSREIMSRPGVDGLNIGVNSGEGWPDGSARPRPCHSASARRRR
jgi:diadenosine tetraphosphate (Ap4A) HIT family hydrolase